MFVVLRLRKEGFLFSYIKSMKTASSFYYHNTHNIKLYILTEITEKEEKYSKATLRPINNDKFLLFYNPFLWYFSLFFAFKPTFRNLFFKDLSCDFMCGKIFEVFFIIILNFSSSFPERKKFFLVGYHITVIRALSFHFISSKYQNDGVKISIWIKFLVEIFLEITIL